MVAKNKPTVEEKREQARKVILDAAMELFHVKGYDNTTTRDIINKAGILNGSLYNRFKNKDEILISIVKDGLQEILAGMRAIMNNEKNLLLSVSFPGALQLYLAYHSPHIAELLYRVHTMWPAVEAYADMNIKWSNEFLTNFGLDCFDSEEIRFGIESLIGSTGNMIGAYVHGSKVDLKEALGFHVLLVATSLKMPLIGLDSIVERLQEILSADDFVFMGHKVIHDRQSSNTEADN